VACLIFVANDDVKILVISVASLVAADRDAYCVRTDGVVDQVADLVLSQEDAPQSHSSQRQISRQVGISLMTVNRIIKNHYSSSVTRSAEPTS